MKKIVITNEAPIPVGPYSQAVVARGFVFCSGQVAINPESGEIEKGTIEEQTRRALQNISNVLVESGSDLEHVVKCTVYLTDMTTFDQMNQVYKEFFKRDYPARLTVQITSIYGGLGVEIEAIGEVKNNKEEE